MHWRESSRNFAAHGYLPFLTVRTDKKLQGRVPFGGSKEVNSYHFFISFELLIIIKLNHDHLHENENAVVEINNSQSFCITKKNSTSKLKLSLASFVCFVSGINGKLLFVKTYVNE